MFQAKTIMSRDVICISPDTDVYEAIRILLRHNITGLPVVNEEGEIVGMVSEKDMLHLMAHANDRAGRVADYMSEQVVTFDENDSLVDIADCFITHYFRRVPILAHGKLVGIISRRDVVRYILNLRHRETATSECS